VDRKRQIEENEWWEGYARWLELQTYRSDVQLWSVYKEPVGEVERSAIRKFDCRRVALNTFISYINESPVNN